MPGWQLTATTIYCDEVSDEVTVMVQKDWTVKCTGARRLAEQRSGGKKQAGDSPACNPALCERVLAYRGKLQAEEGKPA
jgi:hypothetical protein